MWRQQPSPIRLLLLIGAMATAANVPATGGAAGRAKTPPKSSQKLTRVVLQKKADGDFVGKFTHTLTFSGKGRVVLKLNVGDVKADKILSTIDVQFSPNCKKGHSSADGFSLGDISVRVYGGKPDDGVLEGIFPGLFEDDDVSVTGLWERLRGRAVTLVVSQEKEQFSIAGSLDKRPESQLLLQGTLAKQSQTRTEIKGTLLACGKDKLKLLSGTDKDQVVEIDTDKILSLRFGNAFIDDFSKAITVLQEYRATNHRDLVIHNGNECHDVKSLLVSYQCKVSPWKAHYRATIESDASTSRAEVVGWALVENETPYDWGGDGFELILKTDKTEHDLGNVTLKRQQAGLFPIIPPRKTGCKRRPLEVGAKKQSLVDTQKLEYKPGVDQDVKAKLTVLLANDSEKPFVEGKIAFYEKKGNNSASFLGMGSLGDLPRKECKTCECSRNASGVPQLRDYEQVVDLGPDKSLKVTVRQGAKEVDEVLFIKGRELVCESKRTSTYKVANLRKVPGVVVRVHPRSEKEWKFPECQGFKFKVPTLPKPRPFELTEENKGEKIDLGEITAEKLGKILEREKSDTQTRRDLCTVYGYRVAKETAAKKVKEAEEELEELETRRDEYAVQTPSNRHPAILRLLADQIRRKQREIAAERDRQAFQSHQLDQFLMTLEQRSSKGS